MARARIVGIVGAVAAVLVATGCSVSTPTSEDVDAPNVDVGSVGLQGTDALPCSGVCYGGCSATGIRPTGGATVNGSATFSCSGTPPNGGVVLCRAVQAPACTADSQCNYTQGGRCALAVGDSQKRCWEIQLSTVHSATPLPLGTYTWHTVNDPPATGNYYYSSCPALNCNGPNCTVRHYSQVLCVGTTCAIQQQQAPAQ